MKVQSTTPQQIAIYGKGGIGKSTISANLSAALAALDQKVLQVGCDPKHDSTRLLMNGQEITTVLDYLKETAPNDYQLDDILFRGFRDVACVEAGGPEPGVGCAGRGILSTFKLLEDLGVRQMNFDTILYDVLGDVVCGGFAVPIRREYADRVYIVTSGEYMSIYAANNILKGVKNYDQGRKRVGGIIFNQRGIADEEGRIKRFAEAVNLPVCVHIPRSNEFAIAEKEGMTLTQRYPESEIRAKFEKLALEIVHDSKLYEASPLSDIELEEVVLQQRELEMVESHGSVAKAALGASSIPQHSRRTVAQSDIVSPKAQKLNGQAIPLKKEEPKSFISKSLLYREPLHGCAYNGGIGVTIQIKDAITLSHGPASCAHMANNAVTSIGRRALFERGSVLAANIIPPLQSTDMDESVMVFGGMDLLRKKMENCLEQKPSAVFVVTSCTPGIIGDDLENITQMSTPECPVVPIKADGDMAGDYLQGVIMAHIEIARHLIDRNVLPLRNKVNIIGERSVGRNAEENHRIVEELVASLGLEINCRYIKNSTVDQIRNFMTAEYNILALDDYMGRMMKDFLVKEFGAKFFPHRLPVGFHETSQWLQGLAQLYNKEHQFETLIDKKKEEFQSRVDELKPYLKGKRLLVVMYMRNIDWLLETAFALEMEVVQINILNSCMDDRFTSRYADDLKVVENYEFVNQGEELAELQPDILLTNYNTTVIKGDFFCDTIPYSPSCGFFSGIELASRWKEIFNMNIKESWKNDGDLFTEYFA
jgi:nitrogenase iron protein